MVASVDRGVLRIVWIDPPEPGAPTARVHVREFRSGDVALCRWGWHTELGTIKSISSKIVVFTRPAARVRLGKFTRRHIHWDLARAVAESPTRQFEAVWR